MPITREVQAAQGRPHRGLGRGRRRHGDGAGVRPRGGRALALRRRARARCATSSVRQAGVEARFLPGLIFMPTLAIAAVLLVGGRRVASRRPHRGRVRALHHAAAPARLAARGARLDRQPRPARARVRRPQLRLARGHRAAAASRSSPRALPAGPLPVSLRGRARPLRRGRRGAARRRPRDRGRARSSPSAARPAPARRRCSALLPRFYDPTAGRVLLGRRRRARRAARRAARGGRRRHAAPDPLLGAAAREPHSPAGRTRRGRTSSPPCEAAGVAAFVDDLPGRLRHADRRARREPLRRPAPARRPRARAARAARACSCSTTRCRPSTPQTERLLVRNLRPAVEGTTVLIATQRLSTVQVADRAVVLDGGRVVEDGTPTELLAARRALRRRSSETRSSVPRRRTRPDRASGATPRAAGGASPGWRVVAVLAAAAPAAGWLLVGRALDAAQRGRRSTGSPGSSRIYVAVNARGLVASRRCRGAALATLGQEIVLSARRDLFDHLTQLSLRYFSEQRAGWIIARLTSDVDALSDVLSQGLATLVSNVLVLVAASSALFVARLAARPRRARRPAAGPPRHALVPAPLARGVQRRAHEDLAR